MKSAQTPSGVTQKVDRLMRELYRQSRGQLHQTVLADFSVADAYRNYLEPDYPISNRPIVRTTRSSWRALRKIMGARWAVRLGGILWAIVGLPGLAKECLKLHPAAYLRQGNSGANSVLLRTGVANEPLIARWAERRDGESVVMLLYDEKARKRISSLRHFPALLSIYGVLCLLSIRAIIDFLKESPLTASEQAAIVPAWFVLLARRAASISWNHLWALKYLRGLATRRLYFTMNYAHENAFRLAIPEARAAYVEHGFPRRDVPPLPCQQFVYSRGYAEYLRSFDTTLDVEVIGLDYFDKSDVQSKRTILVASLQDWPQFKIERVQESFNSALDEARRAEWKLVFRTRRHDADAFAKALRGPWDEVSEAHTETFQQCLLRTQPAMVWTTWSTAVLDARACGILPVAFVTPDIYDYFIPDLESVAFVVKDAQTLLQLCESLRQDDCQAPNNRLKVGIGAQAHALTLARS